MPRLARARYAIISKVFRRKARQAIARIEHELQIDVQALGLEHPGGVTINSGDTQVPKRCPMRMTSGCAGAWAWACTVRLAALVKAMVRTLVGFARR